MATKTNFTTTVQEYDDTEELYIEIPESIIKQLGWNEGTEIDWKIQEQSIILSKVEDPSISKQQFRDPNIIIKEEIDHYLESESEGKDYDEIYDQYIQAVNEETYGTNS